MHLSTLLVAAALCCTAYSQTKLNLTALETVLAQFPKCSTVCAAKQLEIAECPLTSWQDCLCANQTLRYEVAACILSTCTLEEQIKATMINQDELCSGYHIPSRSNEFVRAAIIIALITYPMVLLRFISRIYIARRVWWDDWFILLATMGMIANTIVPSYLAYHGFGVHIWDTPPMEFVKLSVLFWVCSLFYIVIQTGAKFSILFLYIRIFPTPRFRLATKLFMGFMAAHVIAFTLAVIFQCAPISFYWNKEIKGQCVNSNHLAFAGAGFSIFEDFFVMLLPIWVLKDLQMSLKKRIELFFMFAIGSFACITSMMRLKYMISFGKSIDETWENIPVVLWSMIETYTAVICACLMTIRPLLTKCFPVIFNNTKNASDLDSPPNSNNRRSTMAMKPRSGNWNWGQQAADKFRARKGENGDEVYLTNLTGSTMISGMKIGMQGTRNGAGSPESGDDTLRASTPRSEMELRRLSSTTTEDAEASLISVSCPAPLKLRPDLEAGTFHSSAAAEGERLGREAERRWTGGGEAQVFSIRTSRLLDPSPPPTMEVRAEEGGIIMTTTFEVHSRTTSRQSQSQLPVPVRTSSRGERGVKEGQVMSKGVLRKESL